MDNTKSKVLLNKINAFFQNTEVTQNEFSNLERELLLQYLRELYDNLKYPVSDSGENSEEVRAVRNHVTEVQPVEKGKDVEVVAASYSNGQSRDHSVMKEREIEQQTILPEEADSQDELSALFDEILLIDPSNRFAKSPVQDISRAMGINERILTINELFKGDQKKFQDVVAHLNECSSYEEAKSFLIGDVASANDWLADKKRKKVEIFLSLVRRRYL